jgi:hypothetical protein
MRPEIFAWLADEEAERLTPGRVKRVVASATRSRSR